MKSVVRLNVSRQSYKLHITNFFHRRCKHRKPEGTETTSGSGGAGTDSSSNSYPREKTRDTQGGQILVMWSGFIKIKEGNENKERFLMWVE